MSWTGRNLVQLRLFSKTKRLDWPQGSTIQLLDLSVTDEEMKEAGFDLSPEFRASVQDSPFWNRDFLNYLPTNHTINNTIAPRSLTLCKTTSTIINMQLDYCTRAAPVLGV
jgi:hypothetical protein